jgi:hypothetical protein
MTRTLRKQRTQRTQGTHMDTTVIRRTVSIVVSVLAYSTIAGAQQPAKKLPVRQAGITAVQGFNVVLVLGDLDGVPSDGNGNVPTAARKALADMKDFLPYKSYRLLDSAWILSASESTSASSRLRGPDDRDYELTLGATSEPNQPGTRTLRMTFQLRDPGTLSLHTHVGGREASATPTLDFLRSQASIEALRRSFEARQRDAEAKKGGERVAPPTAAGRETSSTPSLDHLRSELEQQVVRRAQTADLEARAATVREEIAKLRERYTEGHPQLIERQAELNQILQQMAVTRRALTAAEMSRPIIDTGFTMDVGETVVVGTSRVRGEKAIIALLTAVPRGVKK